MELTRTSPSSSHNNGQSLFLNLIHLMFARMPQLQLPDFEFDQAMFSQADTMVISLTVVLLVAWLLALSPFADITRQILDSETRRAVLTKKPYAR